MKFKTLFSLYPVRNAPSPQSSPRRGEEIMSSLEREGLGEGEFEAYPASHFIK